jgi:hypothetical protein
MFKSLNLYDDSINLLTSAGGETSYAYISNKDLFIEFHRYFY